MKSIQRFAYTCVAVGFGVFTGAGAMAGSVVLYSSDYQATNVGTPQFQDEIDQGYATADSFTLSSAATLTEFDFGALLYRYNALNQPDFMTSIDWSILNGVPGTAGVSTLASGTATVDDGGQTVTYGGYSVHPISFLFPTATSLVAGDYWIELQNAVVTRGDVAVWTESAGPSQVWSSQYGLLPTASDPSNNFEILGTVATGVPEPASWGLMGFGFGLLGGAVRMGRRRRRVAFQS